MVRKSEVMVPHGAVEGKVGLLDTTSKVGIPVLYVIPVAAGAAAVVNVTVQDKFRVTDVWAVHTGGVGEASDTLTVGNAGNAITNAMDWSGGDKAVVRAGEIDDAYHEIAKGGTLRVTPVDNDTGDDLGAGIVYVQGVRVA